MTTTAKSVNLPMMRRTMPLVRAESDSSDAPAEIAVSSEYEVVRTGWFGERWVEILDHTAAAVMLDRAEKQRGLAMLEEHDTRRRVGKVADLRVDKDKVLRGVPRFSANPLGAAARQDFDADLLTEVSVGYRIHEAVLERTDKDTNTDYYRITRWEPLEVSLVAVPADPTVGKGRSDDEAVAPVVVRSLVPAPKAKEQPMSDRTTDAPAPSGADVQTAAATATSEERARIGNIFALARTHGIPQETADKWAADGASLDKVRELILAAVKQRDIDSHVPTAPIELSEKEQRRYSFARALLDGDPTAKIDAGFEREVSAEIRRRLPKEIAYRGGMLIPTMLGSTQQRAGLDSKTSTTGLELKFDVPGDFIELLRKRMKLRALGMRVLSGLTGPVTFPRQSGAGTAAWVGENPGSDASDSNLTLDTVALAFKTLVSTTSFSRQLLFSALSASVDAEQMVREDLAQVLALAADLAGINGSGSSNQPTGILSTSGIGDVAGGTNGLAPTWGHIVELETDVANANADIGTMAYLSNALVRGKLKQTLQNTTSGASFIWGGSVEATGVGAVNGYPAHVSNQVPSNLTKGTSTTICSAIIFGVFNELIMGEWGVMEVITDPYRLKKQAMIEVTAYNYLDFAIRHPASFSAMKDALTT